MQKPLVTKDYLSFADKKRINEAARNLQLTLWNQRSNLWPGKKVEALDVLQPDVAVGVLGATYEEHESLGDFGYRGQKFTVAGLVDRQQNKIAVAYSFPAAQVRFTTAHEVGHWVLHPNDLHFRERPITVITQIGTSKPYAEREADYFAACFLIPDTLLRKEFSDRFGSNLPINMDDNVAYYLNPNDPSSLLIAEETSLERELAFATCRHYAGNHFDPLTARFGVSATAMAIRINDLRLIRWP